MPTESSFFLLIKAYHATPIKCSIFIVKKTLSLSEINPLTRIPDFGNSLESYISVCKVLDVFLKPLPYE